MSTGAAGTPRPPDPAGRVRVPPPLIRNRLPSGRGATEQPNATGDGDAALTPVFWLMVAATGVAAGLLGDLMSEIVIGMGASIGRENGYIRLIGWVTHHAAVGRAAVVAPVAAFGIMIPMIAATVTATMVARHVDGYSIYTARL